MYDKIYFLKNSKYKLKAKKENSEALSLKWSFMRKVNANYFQ